MKRLFGILAIIVLFCFSVGARAKYIGVAQKGGKAVKTSSITTFELMETYPSCTITIYIAGTTTLASIYSNSTGTIKSNPFTAGIDASYLFYANNGRYDIKFSGTGIVTPFTLADVRLFDPQDLELNILEYGADPTGTSDSRTAIYNTLADASLISGAIIRIPTGTFKTLSALPIDKVSNVVFRGDNPTASIITTPGSFQYIFGESGLAAHDIAFENIGFASTGLSDVGLHIAGGLITGSFRVSNCNFIGKSMNGVDTGTSPFSNLLIEKSIFDGMGTGTGNSIYLVNGGFHNIRILNNKFNYVNAAINVGGVPIGNDGNNISSNIIISGNTFNGGWWSLVENFSGTANYATTTLTDSGANFSGISAGAYVRAMPVLQTGTTSTINGDRVTDSSASYIVNGVKKGYILKIGSAFGIVSSVDSATQLRVYEWLSNTTRLPIATPSVGSYTVYKVLLGNVSSNTSTVITVGKWFDLVTGTTSTPTNGTRYELAKNFPSVGIQVSTQNTVISNNILFAGQADQLTINGQFNVAEGNIIEYGQDMGITVEGGHNNIISNNVVNHQGTNGIILLVDANDNLILNNHIYDSGAITGSTANIFIQDSNRNKVSHNHLEQMFVANTQVRAVTLTYNTSGKTTQENQVESNVAINYSTAPYLIIGDNTAADPNPTDKNKFVLNGGYSIPSGAPDGVSRIPEITHGATNTEVVASSTYGIDFVKNIADGSFGRANSALFISQLGDSTGIGIGSAPSYSFIDGRYLRLNPAGAKVGIGLNDIIVVDSSTGEVIFLPITFANLPASPTNGSQIYCSNCKNVVDDAAVAGAACVSGGTGSFAKRLHGKWVCN